MRTIICKQCKTKFYEDDSNPNVHYSNPAEICGHCQRFNNLKVGDWYQDANGEYKQKG